jgi:hypothetical protein
MEAALELHKGEPSIHGGDNLSCSSCGVDDGWYNVPWPCPTILAIRTRLTRQENSDARQ